MTCGDCGHEPPAGSTFCNECGAKLAVICPSCGATPPPASRFCNECGATLAAAPGPSPPLVRPALESPPAARSDARKVVTIVFADLAGSTALHERLDPESVRSFMAGYYRAMSAAVAAHGGTVVKLLGDGVMAAFGVPQVSEDDAIRAVRAGVDMQQAFRELAREHADIDLRIAINTGEVVVGADNSDVLGDPVNVAARLQQEARGGDVVIGETTRRLVATRVTLEPLGSVVLRGRAEQVRAWRVVSLERPTGVATAAFVGRNEEMGRITAVFDAAAAQPGARLAVLLGSPGLGKSRLIGEVIQSLGENATVIAAQCDAAGGATFAPIAGALREYLGAGRDSHGEEVDGLQRIVEAAIPTSDSERNRIAGGIAALLAGSPSSPEETFFVVRRFLTGLATVRPVVLVIDDLHWAEPLLLDLVEHLVQWGSGVALLVLIGARPELRDLRSSLVTRGGLVSDVVTLGGLDAGAVMQLAANVIGASDLPAALAAKVLSTTEGNPLFVGELVRMLVDEGAIERHGDRWTIGANLVALEMPPTIQALLAARIERLRPEERAVLEHASVVGRQFSRGALSALLGRNGSELDVRLEALRRSELIEPDTGWFLGEPVLRFHHMLIRDAAYRRLLKGKRAELHAQLAEWIEAKVAGAPEHDETVGRHLEQAHELLCELGQLDPKGRALGERAAVRLSTAGRRALVGDDVPLAANLLGRAIRRLDNDDPARAELALDWCEALLSAGDVVQTKTALAELGRFLAPPAAGGATLEEANTSRRRLTAWHACFAGQLTVLTAPQGLEDAATSVSAAARELAAIGDSAGEAKAHFVHALALARLGEVGDCEAALDRALAAARGAGDRRRANTVLAIAPVAALWGPSPVTRASGRCLDVVRVLRITQGAPAVEAVALSCQGVLEALRGRTEAARRMIASAHEMVEELGITQRVLEADVSAGLVELLEGDAVAAERNLRGAYEGLRDLGLGIGAAQASALLARALLAQGRDAEAEALSHESELLAGDDLKAAIAWRGVRAEALARRGEHTGAVEFATKAVELAAATDALLDHADARLALAAALRASGRGHEADAEEQRAIALWEAKGATLLAEGARRRGTTASENDPRPLPRGDHREVGPPPAPRLSKKGNPSRRVQPNAATAMLVRLHAHLAARDFDAVAKDSREDMESIDHPSGSSYGREAIVASLRRFFRSHDPHYEAEPLATLGDFLVLARRHTSASGGGAGRFDVGAYENEVLELFEVDESGKTSRTEVFAADKLGAAVARLYERFAELLPEGPQRERAAATARSVAGWIGPIDPDRLATTMTPSMEMVDHRNLGTWSTRGAEFIDHTRLQTELALGFTGRTDGVLALAPDALLVRCAYFGIARDGGGAFENVLLQLFAFGADGLIARGELWEPDLDAEALARFEALTADARHAAAEHSRASGLVSARRMQPNAATTWRTRFEAALAARDFAAVTASVHEDYREIDHPTGSTFGRAGAVASIERLFRSRAPYFQTEPLATLGERLGLIRRRARSSGGTGGRWDVGPFEHEAISIVETAEDGRMRSHEVFAADRLGAAIARLYERHAELLPEGPERTRAMGIARSIRAYDGPVDPDHLATVLVSSYRVVDHRILRTWFARDADEHVTHWRLQRDLAPDFAHRFEDVLACSTHSLVACLTALGTARESGGPFENRVCALFRFGADGRVTSGELFEAEQKVEALARFDELTAASSPRAVRRRVRPNAVSATGSRFMAAFAAGDRDGLAALVHDEYREVDHSTGSEWGRDAALRSIERLLRSRDPRYYLEELATLGERHGLNRRRTSASGDTRGRWDVGPYEHEAIQVVEVAEDGRLRSQETFAADRLGDAIARLYEMYGESHGDAAERARAEKIAYSVATWNGPTDLDHLRTAYAPEGRNVDHRVLSTWDAGDREEVIRHLRLQLETVPDFAGRYDDVLALDDRGLAARMTFCGTARDSGGAMANSVCALFLFGDDGRVSYSELFESEQTEEALARCVELTAGVPLASSAPARSSVPNLAQQATERTAACWRARDWDGFAHLAAAGFRFDDRRSFSHVVLDVDAYVLFARALGDMASARLHIEYLATRGDRLCLTRHRFAVAAGDVGPSDLEYSYVVEADDDGRVVCLVAFDSKDLDAAYAELDRRFEERQGAAAAKEGLPARAEGWRESFAPIEKRNLASAWIERVWVATDALISERTGTALEAVRSLCAPELVWEDRRPIVRLSGGVDLFMASLHERVASGARNGGRAIVGTAGDRVAIARGLWVGGPPDGGFEVEMFTVIEVNEAALATAVIFIDPDDWRAAQREAWKRWVAIDPRAAQITKVLGDGLDAYNSKDPERVRACAAEDLVVEDRRRTGTGRVDGREAYMQSLVALSELVTDARLEGGQFWLAVAPDCGLFTHRLVGNVLGGGELEIECLALLSVKGGRARRLELFEIDAADVALARFEELRAESARE